MAVISQLITTIPGQLITAALWNNEFQNIYNVGLIPSGIEDFSATNGEFQTQTDPFPGSVISRPTSLQGELERLRFEIAEIKGETYHYLDADIDLATLKTHDHSGSNGDQIVTDGIADGAITSAKIAADTVVAADIAAGAVGTSELGADSVTNAKIADTQIDSEHYVNGSIDRVHLAADIVDGTKIDDDVVDSEHYVAGSIDNEHLAANSVDSDQYVDGSIDNEHLAANSVDSDQYVDGSIDSAHFAAGSVDATALGSNAVTTAKILDANVTEAKLASGVVNKLGQNIGFIAITGSNVNVSGGGRLRGVCGSGTVNVSVVIDGVTVHNGALNSACLIWSSSGIGSGSGSLNSADIHFKTSLAVTKTGGGGSITTAYELE